MINGKVIKIIGIAATVAGMGLSLVSSWVGDKKMEMEVQEKVNEAVNETLEALAEKEIES